MTQVSGQSSKSRVNTTGAGSSTASSLSYKSSQSPPGNHLRTNVVWTKTTWSPPRGPSKCREQEGGKRWGSSNTF